MTRRDAGGVMLLMAAVAVGGCSSTTETGPSEDAGTPAVFRIGANLPQSGALAAFGQAFEVALELAADQINAQRPATNTMVEFVVLDNGTESSRADQIALELSSEHQVAAMVGPAKSDAVRVSLPTITSAALFTISPSSTAAALAEADDQGFLFRNVANNDHQARVLAYYVHEVATAAQSIVVHQDDEECSRLAARFAASYRTRGGQVLATVPASPEPDPSSGAQLAWDQLAAHLPSTGPLPVVVACVYSPLAENLVRVWHDSGSQPELPWLFADGVRTEAFVQALPPAVSGLRGANPTHGDGAAFDEYAAAFGPGFAEHIFEPMYYDAAFLLALGLAQQATQLPQQPLGGEELRLAMSRVAGPPGEHYRPSQWPQALAAIEAGTDIDFDGASGSCDFDAQGEAPGPYEIWELVGGQFVEQLVVAPELP